MHVMVAAMGPGYEIGRNGGLPWRRLPGELAWFRQATLGRTVLMGRRTWEGLPGGLPGRRLIVLTTRRLAGVETCLSITDALLEHPGSVIAGGGEIYRQAMPHVSSMLLTRVDGSWMTAGPCDTFFPVPSATEWTYAPTGRSGEGWMVEEWRRVSPPP